MNTKNDIFYEHRVSYGETDAMAVLYYAEFAHIFERARGKFCRELGLPYKEIEERGIILPVTEMYCRYKKPAHYDDLLQIKLDITEWKNASFKFSYTMYDEERKQILATGFTVHACVNKDGKPVKVPDWLKNCFI